MKMGCTSRPKRRVLALFLLGGLLSAASEVSQVTNDDKPVHVVGEKTDSPAADDAGAPSVSTTPDEMYSEFIDSVRGQMPEALASLVERGVDPDRPDDRKVESAYEGITALMYAANDGALDVASKLIDLGADPNKPTEVGGTPLIVAAMNGHEEIVGLLLEEGATIDKVSSNFGTALMAGAQNGHHAAVKALIEAGADVNIPRPDDGVTALMMAALADNHEEEADFPLTVRALLKAGARVDQESKEGGTAIHAAEQSNISEVKAALENAATMQAYSRAAANKLRVDKAARRLKNGGMTKQELVSMRKKLKNTAQGKGEL
jgi:ankyrin repeat protein